MEGSSTPRKLILKIGSRPTWSQYFKDLCLLSATRSPCSRLQVGCILVNENRIVSQAYNGFIAGAPHTSIIKDDHEQATIHAEQNALIDCAKRGVSCQGATAYITAYPCLNCYKLLCAGGIKEIFYINEYKIDPLVATFVEITGVKITKI